MVNLSQIFSKLVVFFSPKILNECHSMPMDLIWVEVTLIIHGTSFWGLVLNDQKILH